MKHNVVGLGGVFFKAKDPAALNAWYKQHLGLPAEPWGVQFNINDVLSAKPGAYNVWSAFKETTEYLSPSSKPFMFNFIVDDLHGLLAQLREEGIETTAPPQEGEYGKFCWIMDPEGNKVELWEPPAKAE
jgi:predicted enzyme related to lactoylglutathione lyase